jgi:transcriptional regulator with XRE-family HTH domain
MLGVLMPIKDRLKQLRAVAGLTQQQLAVAAGLSVSAVSQIEQGTNEDPRASTLRALAKALGCKVDDLFDNGGEPGQAGTEPAPEPPKRGRKGKGK